MGYRLGFVGVVLSVLRILFGVFAGVKWNLKCWNGEYGKSLAGCSNEEFTE